MYLGLLNFSILLVFGIAGLTGSVESTLAERSRPRPSSETRTFQVPPNSTDKQVADLIHESLQLSMAARAPEFALKRNSKNQLVIDFYTVNGVERITVLDQEGRLEIERRRNTIWQYLNNLHSTTINSRIPDWRVRAWTFYNEFAIWSLLGMAGSGVYLWLATRPRYLWAQLAFIAGSGVFVTLYWITR